MLTLQDNDMGVVSVLMGDVRMISFDYDEDDRKSHKSAHALGRAFIAGWTARSALMVVGYKDGIPIYGAPKVNEAGVPVYEGRAA